jgi:hypothetical protein
MFQNENQEKSKNIGSFSYLLCKIVIVVLLKMSSKLQGCRKHAFGEEGSFFPLKFLRNRDRMHLTIITRFGKASGVHACPRTLLRSAVISEEARRKFFEKQGA